MATNLFERMMKKSADLSRVKTPARVQNYANAKELEKKMKKVVASGGQAPIPLVAQNTKYDAFLKANKKRNKEIDKRVKNSIDDYKNYESVATNPNYFDEKQQKRFDELSENYTNLTQEQLNEYNQLLAKKRKLVDSNRLFNMINDNMKIGHIYFNSNDLPNVPSLSNQKNITRFHTTKMKNIPSIYKQGLLSDESGKGFGKMLIKDGATSDDLTGVYTTSRHPFGNTFDTYAPVYSDDVTLQLDIPKEKYKNLSTLYENPEQNYVIDFNDGRGSLLQTIAQGGRTDIFEDNLSPTFLKGGFDDSGQFSNMEALIKNYKCNDDCDDWYQALYDNDFVDADGDWNETLFEKLRKRK